MSKIEQEPVPADDGARTRKKHRGRLIGSSAALLVVAGIGVVVWQQVKPVITARKYRSVTYTVPTAPRLTAASGQKLYRIDPSASSLSYDLTEHIVGGAATSHATGLTNGIAGDIVIDSASPAKSHIGQIVANVEQLHSDNNLRDARIRQDFLQSHEYPLATFDVTAIHGLPSAIEPGTSYPLTLDGTARVHGKKAAVTWSGKASVDNGKLTATATTHIKLSTFDVGPISLQGLVHTSDDATLTLKLSALDPGTYAIPTHITGPHAKQMAGGPSFKADVLPILATSCASCHNTGQVGALHWTLDTAADAAKISDGIKTTTGAHYMPPWPASDKGLPLTHSLRLPQSQIDTLASWAEHGGKLDVADTAPVRPSKQVTDELPRKDIVLKMAQPYTGVPSIENDYRCFVLDPHLTQPTFLTGYTFLPDQITEIHHSQVFHISAEQKANALATKSPDGRPGFQCYGGVDVPGRSPSWNGATRSRTRDVSFAGQSNLVAGWVPGQLPVIYPEHSGILMEPGDALVMQLHYHFDGKITPDQSGLALQVTPQAGSTVKKLRIINPLGPVELPCMKGTSGPLCNREAAIKDDVRLYGPQGAFIENGLLGLCGQTPAALQARFDGYVGHTTCDGAIPMSGTIVGVMGHMHTLGKSFRLTLDADTSKQKILLDLPVWNFGWQMNYGLATPLHVTAGEPLRMDCSWDRRLDPTRKPKYIVFAEGTEDEMCFGTYALIPDDQG